MIFDLSGKSVFVAGHRGMVGAALVRALEKRGDVRLITALRKELDLSKSEAVQAFFKAERPDVVVLAAARVGGILANTESKSNFLFDNLEIQNSVIGAARAFDTQKLLFLGSSCIFPKHAEQPIRESSLLTGPLEPTNEAYAIAKIAGLKLCEYLNREEGRSFISAQPCNLYGPGDNYHSTRSHVIPALMRRLHEAKVKGHSETVLWGTGRPLREFLFVDDLAQALVLLLQKYDGAELINVGSGTEISIAHLAKKISKVVGYTGKLRLDKSKPDGTPRKLMDNTRISNLGWSPQVDLNEGLKLSYADFLQTTF